MPCFSSYKFKDRAWSTFVKNLLKHITYPLSMNRVLGASQVLGLRMNEWTNEQMNTEQALEFAPAILSHLPYPSNTHIQTGAHNFAKKKKWFSPNLRHKLHSRPMLKWDLVCKTQFLQEAFTADNCPVYWAKPSFILLAPLNHCVTMTI